MSQRMCACASTSTACHSEQPTEYRYSAMRLMYRYTLPSGSGLLRATAEINTSAAVHRLSPPKGMSSIWQ